MIVFPDLCMSLVRITYMIKSALTCLSYHANINNIGMKTLMLKVEHEEID